MKTLRGSRRQGRGECGNGDRNQLLAGHLRAIENRERALWYAAHYAAADHVHQRPPVRSNLDALRRRRQLHGLHHAVDGEVYDV